MTYIKINKPSLDYHQYSDFHVFTMNNFVRNVMKNGKYKKAIRLVRLGLLYGLKELKYKMKLNDDDYVSRNYRFLPRSYLKEETKKNILTELENKNERYKMFSYAGKLLIKQSEPSILNDYRLHYYQNLFNTIKTSLNSSNTFKTVKLSLPAVSFYNFFNYLDIREDIDEFYPKNFEEIKYFMDDKGHINSSEIAPIDKHNFQYTMFEQLNFVKIYTKKPHTHYYGIRNLTAFDMVIQVYTMLTGVWYMRKAKVSGRTILIPSPLRPYRRITTVTKMLMKGIRGRRKEERFWKKAMIQSIGKEFYWLLLYNGFQYIFAPCIDNSKVWNAKMDSHKELVHNLKNIKHLKYF